MIAIVQGNLFDTIEDVIVHQVNCQGVMGSGVAKSVRHLFPLAYKKYFTLFKEYERSRKMLLGYAQIVEDLENNKTIVNLFAQETFGRDGLKYTSYEAFYQALVQMDRDLDEGLSIAMPYHIGCDRGGADWDIIFLMIQKVLKNRTVTIYKLEEENEHF